MVRRVMSGVRVPANKVVRGPNLRSPSSALHACLEIRALKLDPKTYALFRTDIVEANEKSRGGTRLDGTFFSG